MTVQSTLPIHIRRTTFPETLNELGHMSRVSTASKVHLGFLLGKMIKALLPFILSKMLSAKIT